MPRRSSLPSPAVVALNAALGQRGTNALRLLLEVVVGIVAGEIIVVGAVLVAANCRAAGHYRVGRVAGGTAVIDRYRHQQPLAA
jgi:hypothetical protein